MPSLNIIKEFAPDSYYHIYNRGVEKRQIFIDEQDYTIFLGLLKKYLTGVEQTRRNRHSFTPLTNQVKLLSYCLMPNHFHLLIYQTDEKGITELMRRVATGYVMYFNNRYNRVGGLFQGRYKAKIVLKDEYLHHISRYIHLNPKEYKTWPYTSLKKYAATNRSDWVNTEHIPSLFGGSKQRYMQFVGDYHQY